MAQLTNRRSNRTALQVTVTVGDTNVAPVINFTDSKSFAWTAAAPTDSGKDISKFFKVFAIQVVENAGSTLDYTIEMNVGGEWVDCPTTLIHPASNAIDSSAHGTAIVVLPIHGVQLRLLADAAAAVNVDQTITILMSDSSERADVGRA